MTRRATGFYLYRVCVNGRKFVLTRIDQFHRWELLSEMTVNRKPLLFAALEDAQAAADSYHAATAYRAQVGVWDGRRK